MIPFPSRRRASERARLRRLFALRSVYSPLPQPANADSAVAVPRFNSQDHAALEVEVGLPEDEFDALVQRLRSPRRVRPVVTPSGHRARGRLPSLKTHAAKFESLVEQDTWRVLEVSSQVRRYATHPTVFALPDAEGGKVKHYTPDATVAWRANALCLEVKGLHWMQMRSTRDALRATVRSLRAAGVPLALVSEADVRQNGLQDELRELLRLRPSAGLSRQTVDATAWDPLHQTEPDAATLKRWRQAQHVCYALLERVMRRDPDQFIQSIPIKY